ncbi:hypothetical protein BBK82_03190 [Lentzea guizhouensis]|uniref:Glycosyltransferase n=1 Tax=Lentzea guizhouensis TaxID=1586287 RepID=A0A1B2HBZ0_9PSEU|nr:glycosyltransferase family 2 protein [Lentzea guizhouensis]ANZ35222.1 hypothetical protein BBK82_03190 [Lentzea guizhouensis]
MADLLMIVPTRGRPHNIAALLEAWSETTVGDTELLIALDDDDPALSEYLTIKPEMEWPPAPVHPPRWISQSRLRLAGTLNALAVAEAQGGRHKAIGFMGDDHRPRTRGWDAAFSTALADLGTGVVYGNDLIQGAALPTAVAMTADVIAALGYMVPPGLVHLYLDNAWLSIGEGIGRIRYLPEVVIEHMHPLAGKAPQDDGYREVNSEQQYLADRKSYEDWVNGGLDQDLAKLRALLAPAARS